MLEYVWIAELALLGVVGFIQNMAFTWVSRSRNSGDPEHHRYAAWCSNGVWFVTNIVIWRQVWSAMETNSFWLLVASGLVYIVSTSEGSVMMMKFLLKTEKGKRRVGSRGDH